MATRSPGLSAADRPEFGVQFGSEWTGPGGIGDYAASNGNTAEVVNAAHAIRTGQFIDAIAEAKDTGETFDLVVVGGGFSGLSAAYTFKKHTGDNKNCLILDNHPTYVVQPSGFYFGKDGKPAAKDVIRNTIHGRIAFAHSELAGAQVWQTAAAEGKRAVENLL